MRDYKNWKPFIDFVIAVFAIVPLFPFLVIFYLFSAIDVRANGIYSQKRIGQFGKSFTIYKFCTIHPESRKISAYGRFLRKYKIDEFPQLINILKFDMSFVGPRPDIPGFYDLLRGKDREVLLLKPGLTSEASIKYQDEDDILSKAQNPDQYNDEILFPDKVRMNLHYLNNLSFQEDIRIIFKTVKMLFR